MYAVMKEHYKFEYNRESDVAERSFSYASVVDIYDTKKKAEHHAKRYNDMHNRAYYRFIAVPVVEKEEL